MRRDGGTPTQIVATGRQLDLTVVIGIIDKISRRTTSDADMMTLRRFRELTFDCELLAATELERRNDDALRATTKAKMPSPLA